MPGVVRVSHVPSAHQVDEVHVEQTVVLRHLYRVAATKPHHWLVHLHVTMYMELIHQLVLLLLSMLLTSRSKDLWKILMFN